MFQIKQNNLQNWWKFDNELYNRVLLCYEKIKYNLPWFNWVDYQLQVHDVKKVFWNLNRKYDKLLVLWIWWSALWTIAVLSALKKWSNVIVLDNLDPEYCDEIFSNLDWEHTLINVISKSWNTIETLSQLSAVKNILEKKWLKLKDNILITTWIEKNPLNDFASKYDLFTLDVPKQVWWRFSIFTSVSLFPLYFAWIDIEKFINGLIKTIDNLLSLWDDISLNIPFNLAISQIYSYQEWKNISVLMTYNKCLFWLLDWYRQLLAESIWKSKKIWITPVLSLWSTDQHSQLQLYLEWPNDKLITLVNSNFNHWAKTWNDFRILSNKSFWDIQNALLDWTIKSFENYKIPFQEIFIDEINEENISFFLVNFMIQIQIIWEYFWVNTFDQPAVEYWKIKAKEILNN